MNNLDGGSPSSTYTGEITPDILYILQEIDEQRV
jgi:hypothetical protein